MTTDQTPQPELLDPNDPRAAERAAEEVTRTDVASDLHQPAALAHRNPYDVAVPETLRERLAYARMLAAAGILPRDYQAKPANVLVAGEMGRELGLSVIQSVMLLSVVEGKPSLGANGVRAVVQRAGHTISGAQITYNKHGVPVQATVKGTRHDTGQELEVTWTIQRAARAGLCTLRYDDGGEVSEVRARSQYDKVLPWEAYTEDMLDARATVKLGRALFGDVTLGLSYEREELSEGPGLIAEAGTKVTVKQTGASAEPSERAQAVLQQVKPTRRTDMPDDYDPMDDLAEAGATWWEHAGAQVSRRNKQQLAADRLAKWVADNPGQNEIPLPEQQVEPTPETEPADEPADEPVDAVIVEDAPGDPEPDDVQPVSDPWGDAAAREAALADDDVPDDIPGDDGPALDTEPDDAGPDLDGDAPLLTAAELLAEIDAAAEQVGRTRQALMVRWIAAHRKNPDDATAEELLPFVEQLRQNMAERKG